MTALNTKNLAFEVNSNLIRKNEKTMILNFLLEKCFSGDLDPRCLVLSSLQLYTEATVYVDGGSPACSDSHQLNMTHELLVRNALKLGWRT